MPSSSQRTLLVVEDDDDARWALATLLDEEGVRVIEARNGLEALQQLRSLPALPCLILLDLMMPVMNGWQFLEEIQQDALLVGIPIVVLSAMADADQTTRSGATDYLRKPYHIDDVLHCVSRYCPVT